MIDQRLMGDAVFATGCETIWQTRSNAMTQTIVKRYKGERKYQKDAEKMARAGFRVVSVVNRGKPWGFGGVLVKTRYLVTYAKDT